MLRVPILPLPRSPVANLLPLVFNLAYAGLAPAPNVVGDFHQLEDIFLSGCQLVLMLTRRGKGEGKNSRSADTPSRRKSHPSPRSRSPWNR